MTRSAEADRRPSRGLNSRAAHGDAAAFSELYERHHQELFRYCRSIVRHEQDAQDALQSTMIKAFAALQHEQRDLDMRPWLFRIAHNEAISLLRRRRETGEIPDVAAVGATMDERVVQREDLRALRADLADLPDTQRSALVLRELNGLGHTEIAQVLDSSPRSVKQSIYEARSSLLESREGREMACDDIRRTLSDADGRVMRGRRLRAHLRSCQGCRQFRADLVQRPRQLAAMVPPLPAVASAALLHHLLAGTTKAAGTALPTSAGGAALSSGSWGLAGALSTKVAITAAILATAASGTAIVIHGRQAGTRPQHSLVPGGHGPVGSASGLVGAPAASGRSDRSTTGSAAAGARAAPTPSTPGAHNSVAGSSVTKSSSPSTVLPGQGVPANQSSPSSSSAHGHTGATVTHGPTVGHGHAPSVSGGSGHRKGGNSGHHSNGHHNGQGKPPGAKHDPTTSAGSSPAQPAPSSSGGSGQSHGRGEGPSVPPVHELPKLPIHPKHP